MKRRITTVLGIGAVVCVLVAFIYKNSTIGGAKEVTGKELFTDEFVQSVTGISFRPFDESRVITIEDKEKMDEFFEILRNEKYKSLNQYELLEGFYMFDFVTNDGSEDFGLGENAIGFGGSQYKVVSGNDLVQGIIKEIVY